MEEEYTKLKFLATVKVTYYTAESVYFIALSKKFAT
jgi:hypothetical protein